MFWLSKLGESQEFVFKNLKSRLIINYSFLFLPRKSNSVVSEFEFTEILFLNKSFVCVFLKKKLI